MINLRLALPIYSTLKTSAMYQLPGALKGCWLRTPKFPNFGQN